MSSLVVLERHLWLTMTEMKEVPFLARFPSLTIWSRQAACLDQLCRALRNASRRLKSHLKRCDTSSRKAPALLLISVALYLRRLSKQLSQCQPLLSPDLIRINRIEGVHGRHNATPSRSANDPGPRSPQKSS